MTTTIEAMFDGEVFRPRQPVALEPNTAVKLTVETSTSSNSPGGPVEKRGKRYSFLDAARSMRIEDGPPDWSANVDKYLYGEELHGEDARREE